jgi:hypothetical protein
MASPPTPVNGIPQNGGTVPRNPQGKITVNGTITPADQAALVTAGQLHPTAMGHNPKNPDPPTSMNVAAGGTWTFTYSNVELIDYDMVTTAKNDNGQGRSDITFTVTAK